MTLADRKYVGLERRSEVRDGLLRVRRLSSATRPRLLIGWPVTSATISTTSPIRLIVRRHLKNGMRRSATSRRTGTAEWNLGSADTYDAVVLVNVADRLWKAVVTADFEFFRAIAGPNDVADLYWLDGS